MGRTWREGMVKVTPLDRKKPFGLRRGCVAAIFAYRLRLDKNALLP